MAGGLFGGGDGSAGAPLLIEDAADFNAIRSGVSKHYKQVAHIDMSIYANFVPLPNFTGTVDGQNFEIRNLVISSAADAVALFGAVSTPGLIRNISVKNGRVTGTAGTTYHAGIIGNNATTSQIINCHFQGVVITNGTYSGGCFGVGGSYKTCSFNGDVTFNSNTIRISGVAGYNATCVDCHFTGTITCKTNYGVGGIVMGGGATDCTFNGSVTTTTTADFFGICDSSATRCTVTGPAVDIAGIVYGVSSGATDCTNNFPSLTGKEVYGIAKISATRCTNNADLIAKNGIATGIGGGTCTDCKNQGSIVKSIAGGPTAGIAVNINGSSGNATRCINSANVEGYSASVGGIMGGSYNSAIAAKNCYFLGSTVQGSSANTPNIGRITSFPHTNNTANYALDTSQVVLV